MVNRAIYKERFEPIVQAHEFLQTFPKIHYYEVLAILPLPLISLDLCAVGHLGVGLVAGVESVEDEIDEVYLDDDEISHMRWIPREDFDITWLAKPKARPFLTIKNVNAHLPTYYDDPRTNPANEHLQMHELFQFQDTKMWVKATSNINLAAAHLDFFGFRMIVEEVAAAVIPKGLRPTVVPTEGWPGSVEESKETK